MMCGIAGDKYHGRLKLVLNKFEPITNLEPETRVERLTRLWSEHVRGGNAPILSYNPQTTPSAIIQSLLCHETATTLALQRELLEDGRLLRKTTAGTRISAQLAKIKKQVEARKKELKNEMKRLPVNDPQRFIKLARMQALTRRRDILDKELKAWKKSKVKFQRE